MSEKCKPVWKDLETLKPQDIVGAYCLTKSGMMKIVGCLSTKYRQQEGMAFGDSVRRAWKDAKKLCGKP